MLTDVVELRGLADAYARCMDALDQTSFAQLWTPDGVLEVYENGPDTEPTGVLRPRHFHLAFERLSVFKRTLHHVTTHHADIRGDEATGFTHCAAHHIDRPGGADSHDLVMHIVYRDKYRREEQRWRFVARRIEVLFHESRTVQELG